MVSTGDRDRLRCRHLGAKRCKGRFPAPELRNPRPLVEKLAAEPELLACMHDSNRTRINRADIGLRVRVDFESPSTRESVLHKGVSHVSFWTFEKRAPRSKPGARAGRGHSAHAERSRRH